MTMIRAMTIEAKSTFPVSTSPSSFRAQAGFKEKIISQTITEIITNQSTAHPREE